MKVSSLIGDLTVSTGNSLSSSPAIGRTFFLSTKNPLGFSQPLGTSPLPPGVFNVFTIRGGKKAYDSYVNAHSLSCFGQWLYRYPITRENQIPSTSLSFDRNCLYIPLDFTVGGYLYLSNTLKINSRNILSKLAAITITWSLNRVESTQTLEPWITRTFASSKTTKETFKSLVEPSQSSLLGRKGPNSNIRAKFSNISKLSRLSVIANRSLRAFLRVIESRFSNSYLISLSAFGQGCIVKLAMSMKTLFQGHILFSVGAQAKFVGTSHCLRSYFLGETIIEDIGALPQTPIPLTASSHSPLGVF